MKKATVLIALIAFLVGGAAGFAVGGLRGFDRGASLILNSALEKDARDITNRIAVLADLRGGEQKRAIDRIEADMDDLLIGFDPAQPYPGLEAQTAGAMRKAIDDAKSYRKAHPWAEEKNLRANMVRAMFAKDLYR